MTAFARAQGIEGGYDELWRWSVDRRRALLGSPSGTTSRSRASAARRVLTSHEMPGAKWFPGTSVSYAEHIFRGTDDDAVAIRHASELPRAGRDDLGRAARRDRRIRAGLIALRRRPGRPRRRLPAEHPRDDRRLPAPAPRSAPSGPRPRRSSAPAASSTASRRSSRRSCSRSTATATAARTSTAARSSPRSPPASLARAHGPPRLPRRHRLGGRLPRPGATRSSRFERVPFSHPLWILYSSGTTGLPKAIVHSQGGILLEHLKKMHLHVDARPRRPRLLVHDDRLDDVELPRRRAADRGLDRALRRQPRLPDARPALGSRRGGARSPRSGRAPASSPRA